MTSSNILKRGMHFLARKANALFYYYYQSKPIDNKLICFESDGDLTDNSYALFDYMQKNGYLNKYHVVWLVNNIDQKEFHNVKYVKKLPMFINLKWAKSMATCKWYIYDHINVISHYKKRPEQMLVYLSHGWGYKAAKGKYTNIKSTYDIMTATGELSAIGLSEYWNRPLTDTIITGYPRTDYFFENNPKVKSIVETNWNLSKYKKVIFWMPTFRQSTINGLSEEYIKNKTGLPIFDSDRSLLEFSKFLSEQNVLLIFKLHHLQADLPIFHKKFNNILIVNDTDLKNLDIQLYQFIPFADAMISDYSSITIDYLLLDRPIIYTLDDYDEYNKSRGLFPPNAIDYMPGYHVYKKEELFSAISEICEGWDKYKTDRSKLIDKYHTYKDGMSSKRVLKKIGIVNDK